MINNQYFLVEHQFSINVEPLAEHEIVPDNVAFEAEIPAPFRMASDLANIESQNLQPLKLNNEMTQALWVHLQAQNLKINTLLTYVLSQQDDEKFHFQGCAYSAGACLFPQKEDVFFVGQAVRLKIFMPEESAAIYCYAEVTNIKDNIVELQYKQIREEDIELLIRSTLHVQSKQLKQRALLREEREQQSEQV